MTGTVTTQLELRGVVIDSVKETFGGSMRSGIVLAFSLGLLAWSTHADVVAYYQTVDLEVHATSLRAKHHHNWRERESYVEVYDSTSEKLLFGRKSPPLTTLWISPDQSLVVGLSSIRLDNPSQIVVFGLDGRVLLERSIRCGDDLAKSTCSESVSNWVHWYREDNPEIEIATPNDSRFLEISAPLHVACIGSDPERMDSPKWREICSATPERIRIPLPE